MNLATIETANDHRLAVLQAGPLVCVVGAGLAGLASALAAAQCGLRVELFAAEPEVSDIDVHVDIVPSMLRDLVAIGMADEVVRAGFAYRRARFMAADGVALFAIEPRRLAGERYPAAVGIARHAVHRLLGAACEAAGVHFHWHAHVNAVRPTPCGACIHLQDTQVDAQLVVLACGALSRLRTDVLQVHTPLGTTGWTYLVARRPISIDEPVYALADDGRKAHAVPISARHLGLSINDLDASLAPQGLRAQLSQLPGALAELAVLPHSVPTGRSVAFGLTEPRDADAAIVAVGECACALPPHLGYAAAQAIEDAVVLKHVLQHVDVRAVARVFHERRHARRRQVLDLTARAARWDLAPEAQTDLRLLSEALADLHQQPA
jgi:2-polyprenyl-6-methoxyphenol hydroxylase-like FAD-dependent oxidoreductase